MTEIVQIAGGSAVTENQYLGPDRELRVDTTNGNLRLHDNATIGGRIILNRDNADERYQARNAELDGLIGFTPEQRGWLVRRGPADYRLRKLTVDQSLTLTNDDGYAGNPQLSLSDSIDGDRTFTGSVLINGVLQVDGGINADLSGDTTGTHTGPVIGNVTGNLTGDSTGTHTGPSIGDLDVRGHTLLVDDNQIATSKINGLQGFVETHGIPIGAILMWSGAIVDIPTGWQICDGSGGTPNLFDRFIVGAGNTYVVGQTGGNVNSTGSTGAAGSHLHSGSTADPHTLTTAEIPAHSHHLGASGVPKVGTNYGYTGVTGVTGVTLSDTDAEGGGGSHGHNLTLVTDGNHSHSVGLSTLSPYYALAYIQHVGP